jgi:NAD(P)-dependent dehydrogenase (short-subunit alcohol dehydrogenase family)
VSTELGEVMADVHGTDRVVLITGCSRGIGLACAEAFAGAGDRVVATMRDPAAGAALGQRLKAAISPGEVLALDITDDGSVALLMGTVTERYGPIDVLVNNAGVGHSGTLEELTLEDFRQSMDVNFYGAVRMIMAVLPTMRERGAGRIINVTSLGGGFGQPFNDAYCAAKFALEGLAESLYPIARAFGVHVTVVQPGAVTGEFRAHAGGVRTVDADSPFATMHAAYETLMEGAAAGAVHPDEIAAAIVAVANDPAPVPRVQVPESTAKLMGVKLKDLSGERVVGITAKWLG